MAKNNHVQHLLILGDQKTALRWVPWAKTKLRSLQQYDPGFDGESFGKRKYQHTLMTGGYVLVEIKMVKDKKWIIIWAEPTKSLYMESGILDHRATALINCSTYLPSILYYSDDIDAIRGPNAALGELKIREAAPNMLDGENRGEGDSEAVGCPDKDDKIRKVHIIKPGIFQKFETNCESGIPIYCEDYRGLRRIKEVQTTFPPSMFSGKLRLMMQAIYGSKRRDYQLNPFSDSNALPLEFEVRGVEGDNPSLEIARLDYSYNGQTALFSGRNYEYFIIKTEPTGVMARKLYTTEAGEELRQYLIGNTDLPEDRKLEYETYLLSTLYFHDDHRWVEIGSPGDTYKYGSPFAYGWAWNWDGTEARSVCIQQKEGTTNVSQSTVFRMSIDERDLAETLEEGRLVVGTAIEEGTTDFTFRENGDLVWRPDFNFSVMRLFISQADEHDDPVHSDYDHDGTAMYVIYNYKDDQFDYVRHMSEDLGSGQGSLGGPATGSQDSIIGNPELECADSVCAVWSTSDGAARHGFYVEGDADLDMRGKRGDNAQIDSVEFEITGEPLPVGSLITGTLPSPLPCSGGTPSGAQSAHVLHYPVIGTGYGATAGNFGMNSLIALPFYDCDAVYLGAKEDISNAEIDTTFVSDNVQGGIRYYQENDGTVPLGDRRETMYWNSNALGKQGPRVVGHPDGKTNVSDTNVDQQRIRVVYWANGSTKEVYRAAVRSSSSLAAQGGIPSCATSILASSPDESWEETGEQEDTNFDFDPVIFPVADVMPAVEAIASANHYSYYVAENPGQTKIGDDSYDFDHISDYLSYVGFA